METAFLQNREALLRFIRARGGGDAAEDILHDLWLRLDIVTEEIGSPLPYMLSAANRLMIDRHRSSAQAAARDKAWSELAHDQGVSPEPPADRVVASRQMVREVEKALADLGGRPSAIFRRHRLDGVPQKEIAVEFAVSLSTVEADLRRAYRALAALRERSE